MQQQFNSLPLFQFFETLRKSKDYLLGIDDYYFLLDSLEKGFGLDLEAGVIQKEKLLNLCKLLWLKPQHSPFEFTTLFNEYIKASIEKPRNNSDEMNQGSSLNDQSTKINGDDKDTEKKEPGTSNGGTSENNNTKSDAVKITCENVSGENASIEDKNARDKKRNFIISQNYYPINKRSLRVLWDYFPFEIAKVSNDEVDIDQTVFQYAEKGFLTEFIYKKNHQTSNQMILLTDHQGSMAAFETLSDILANSLSDTFNNKTRKKSIFSRYYFYNIPQNYIYKNPSHTKFEQIDKVFTNQQQPNKFIFIVSDAGAARGSNSSERVRKTIKFILTLKKTTNKILWLNPMPENRWDNTSAGRIARFVPMINISQGNLLKIIPFLKGEITG